MTQPPHPPLGPPLGPPPPGPATPGRTAPLLIGAVLGGADAVVTGVLGLGLGLGALGPGNGSTWLGVLVPVLGLLLPVGMLFGAGTRWWGVGMLIGYFAALVVLGGVCAVVLAGLTSATRGS